jgi:hypothetical protein
MADDVAELLDPDRLERGLRALEAIAHAMTEVDREADAVVKRAKDFRSSVQGLDTGVVRFKQVVDKTITELGSRYHYFVRVEFLQGTEDALNRAQARWKAYGEEVQRHLTQARGALGAAGGATGLSSAFGGMKSAVGGIMGNLPFGIGGVLGLILYGRKRSEEFDAAAIKITRIMDQVGAGGRAADAVRSRVVAMHAAFGSMGEELGTVIDQFREFGMGAEIFDKTQHSAGALGKDLVGVVTALEMANRMQPGTIAKEIGEVFEAGAGQREQLLDDFMGLDRIAQQTHVSVERLMNSMTQGAVSLRVQRQGVGDLSSAYVKLFNALSTGAMQGAAPQAVGAAAMRGVQAAAAGIGGLSEGLMAELSRRMGGPEGVAGIISMQKGARGQGKFAGRVFEQLGSLAREVTGGGTPEEQIFALQKIAPSLGFEGARAVVDMMSGGATLKDVQETLKDPSTKLLEAFKHRSREESAWEKVQRQILVHMAQMGSSMLSITMAGFDAVVKALGFAIPGLGISSSDVGKSFRTLDKITGDEGLKIAGALQGIVKATGAGVGIAIPDFIQDAAARKRERDKASADRATAGRAEMARSTDEAGRQVGAYVEGSDKLPPELRQVLVNDVARARKLARTRGGGDIEATEAGAAAVDRFIKEQGLKTQEIPVIGGVKIRIVVEKDDLAKAEATE